VLIFQASSLRGQSEASFSAVAVRASRRSGQRQSNQAAAIANGAMPEVLSLLARSVALVHRVASLLTEFKAAAADEVESQPSCDSLEA